MANHLTWTKNTLERPFESGFESIQHASSSKALDQGDKQSRRTNKLCLGKSSTCLKKNFYGKREKISNHWIFALRKRTARVRNFSRQQSVMDLHIAKH